jgi:hypothetical protein
VFVLGLDREVVATSIEVAYQQTVERLTALESPMATDFGFQFLGKLVQLSVAVPRPRPEVLERFMADLDAAAGNPALVVQAAAERVEKVQDARDVSEAEMRTLKLLEANPRQAKRFHNAFRLQVNVAAAGDAGLTGEQLVALGRWVALRLRWPALADDLDHDPKLLTLLDAVANEDTETADAPEMKRLRLKYANWVDNSDIRPVLLSSRTDPTTRASNLPFTDFLSVA